MDSKGEELLPFTAECHLCGRDTVFADEEAEKPEGESGLRLCNTCQGVWNEVNIVSDIMFGSFNPPLPEEEE